MAIRHVIKRQSYFDSVTLMLIASEVKKLPEIEQVVVGMGTDYNMDSLKRLKLMLPEFEDLTPNDMLICVQGTTQEAADAGFAQAEHLLAKRRSSVGQAQELVPTTQEGAAQQMPDANVVLISVPGSFAAREAGKALDAGRHVMLFSDNVTIDEERRLKEKAVNKKLLLMGPDCGTAILNGVPLAFANAVRKGPIGLVAASGTGLQEVTSAIHGFGYGVSQAIGVGGRDLSEAIGGTMTMFGASLLAEDPETTVLVLISKPPAPAVLPKVLAHLKQAHKPTVIYFIGADPDIIRREGFIAADSLEDAAIKACEQAGKTSIQPAMSESAIADKARAVKLSGTWLRALYSGGTLCDEAQRILLPVLREVSSNTPVAGCQRLADIHRSVGHTVIDLGDDDFTRGKAHPMIDADSRRERLINEVGDPDVAMIAFDVVLGFGSHPDMAGEMADAIRAAKKKHGRLPFLAANILGTSEDPQHLSTQEARLREAGVEVFPTNVALCRFIAQVFQKGGAA